MPETPGIDALSIAARMMAEDVQRLDVASQNLANATTPGYKSRMVVSRSFAEQLSDATDFRQGTLAQTGRALDVAIEGSGFFELAGDGGPVYTRQGAFRLDEGGRLISTGGLPVSGMGGDIVLTGDKPSIDRQGQIFENGRQVGQLKVVGFADPASALTALGGGVYRARAAAEVSSGPLQVRQGFLESSNVVTLGEMMRVMEVVRRFGAAQRIVQDYDGMLGGAIRTLGEF